MEICDIEILRTAVFKVDTVNDETAECKDIAHVGEDVEMIKIGILDISRDILRVYPIQKKPPSGKVLFLASDGDRFLFVFLEVLGQGVPEIFRMVHEEVFVNSEGFGITIFTLEDDRSDIRSDGVISVIAVSYKEKDEAWWARTGT